ncbi:MAG: 2TM domain-containing protein [Bacteroidota bacterium]|nr:2TM domain-containing protein [Bacteroidota bacterium]
MEQQKDERLWRIAKQRADFKKGLYSYIIVNSFLWAIWYFTIGREAGFDGYPWPIWPMLGWGLGLAFQYFKAYNGDKRDLAEREYERLKNEQGN